VRALDQIKDAAGVGPQFYRPPYGIATAATFWVTRSLGLTPVLWDPRGRDWRAEATSAGVIRDVLRDVRGGSTVLLHDSDCTSAPGSWRVTAGALRPLVQRLRAEGLIVGPLRDHAVGRTCCVS
jgi:peptidoglycan-N-acetylglucosamine deacetylase